MPRPVSPTPLQIVKCRLSAMASCLFPCVCVCVYFNSQYLLYICVLNVKLCGGGERPRLGQTSRDAPRDAGYPPHAVLGVSDAKFRQVCL